jgi:serine O-acetyltransferase
LQTKIVKRDFYTRLVYARKSPIFGKAAYYILKLLGIEIPISVKIGKEFILEHGGFGVVVHSKTEIGNRVRIYPGVTIGRSDIHISADRSLFEGIQISNDVILGTGSKILGKKGILQIGEGTIVGANAVVLQSTGKNEIWAGNPARKIGERKAESG